MALYRGPNLRHTQSHSGACQPRHGGGRRAWVRGDRAAVTCRGAGCPRKCVAPHRALERLHPRRQKAGRRGACGAADALELGQALAGRRQRHSADKRRLYHSDKLSDAAQRSAGANPRVNGGRVVVRALPSP
eukprot:scaffold52888_cov70-Phaeocystis_antarctica.AAC.18